MHFVLVVSTRGLSSNRHGKRIAVCVLFNAGNLNGFTWISRQQEVPIVVASLSVTIGSTTYHVTRVVITRKGQYDPETTA
ncbi:hypothetical protein TNCT_396601 [Trichonephila clavata]|uniref:Uncharacterized protein n=1 Tax=Trichonephila clavata TaxID=2740835 RepID=A0A8X6J1Q7_TRICU|nr:hypothetical protein TNCT_396601 [Trichonephila clavata]